MEENNEREREQSISDSQSESEYEEQNTQTLSQHKQIQIEQVLFHIVSKIEKGRLFDTFKGRARFDFVHEKQKVVVRYDQNSILDQVRNFVTGFQYKVYTVDSGNNSVRISDCTWIKQQLKKKEFKVFQLGHKCYIEGFQKKAQDFNEAKAIISAFQYDILQDNLFESPIMSKTEQFIFCSIFQEAMKKVKFNDSKILELNVKFFGKKRNQLKYVVRSITKLKINSLPQQVKQAYKKHKAILLITPYVKRNEQLFSSKYISTSWRFDKRLKKYYLCIVFKRKTQNNQIIQQINKALKFYQSKVQGVRFFEKFIKIKLSQLQQILKNQNNIIERYPQNYPYSVTAKFKCIEACLSSDFSKYLDILKSKASSAPSVAETIETASTNNNDYEIKSEPPAKKQSQSQSYTLSNTISVIKNLQKSSISYQEQSSYPHNQTEIQIQQQKQPQFVFEVKKQQFQCSFDLNNPLTKEYVQFKIVASHPFIVKWDEDESEPERTILKGYGLESMTVDKLDQKYNKFLIFQNIKQIKWGAEEYVIAEVKRSGKFKGMNRSIKPILLIRKKQA